MTDAELRDVARAIVSNSSDLYQDLCKALDICRMEDMTPSASRQFHVRGCHREMRLTLSLEWVEPEDQDQPEEGFGAIDY